MPIIQGKVLEESVIHTDGWKAYGGLILNGYNHYRVFHSKDEFARGNLMLMVWNPFGLLPKEG